MTAPDPRLLDGLARFQARDPAGAAARLRPLVAEQPGDLGAAALLAQVESALGDHARAAELLGVIEAAAPGDFDLITQRAAYLMMASREGEAVPMLERVLAARPDHAHALRFLLAALATLNRPAQAATFADAVKRLGPAMPVLDALIAGPLLTVGRAEESLDAQWRYCSAVRGDLDAALTLASHTNYVMNMPPERIFEVHAWAGGQLAQAAGAGGAAPARAAAPGERVRVGVLSGDLRRHSVAYFIEPVLEHLDPARFDVHVFSTSARPDDVTARLRPLAGAWHDAATLDDAALESALRAAQLDVLIELHGLTAGQRLMALARRPAPVQVTYLGYPNTTGCPFITDRLVDHLTDPPGAESLCVERLQRLEGCFVCFKPAPETPPVNQRDPDAPIVFGCFGSVSKYNEATLYAWARVLAAVPGSRLVIKSRGLREPAARASILERLRVYGVAPDRLDILAPIDDTAGHLAAYHGVDIALDTFPYHGTTTTCEAMLMGVPTVTRIGDRHASRVGLSLNSAVGLTELCGPEDGAYVAAAARLAADRPALAELRRTLRARLLASPLGDGPGFGRRLGRVIERLAGRA